MRTPSRKCSFRHKVWVHELVTVVLTVKVLKKKQVVGLVYSINIISDELSGLNN
jgi:hypothetical protein